MNCTMFSARKFDYIDHHFSRMHKHLYFEINFYLEGSGHTVINGEKYYFSKNSFALIPPGIYHNETFTKSGTVICLMFECNDPQFALREVCSTYDGEESLSFYATNIFKEMAEKKQNSTYICNQLMKSCLNVIQRITDEDSEKFCDSLMDSKIFINENFFKKIDFNLLASKTGYSYDYFRHAFKREFGISPQNYLIKVRLDNSYEMLSSTQGITITEIAASCGFSDISQFSTMFTKRFGISPKKFQSRKGNN